MPALRPLYGRRRMLAGPLLALRALRDPDGPGVGFGAGGRKGAAESAAGSSASARLPPRLETPCPSTRAARVPTDSVRGSAEPALPGKKLLLAPLLPPFFCSRVGGAQWRGGSPSPRAPPPRPPPLPVLTGPPNLSSPLRVRRRTELLAIEINSPVTTHTRARTHTHAHTHTHTHTHAHGLRFGL